jgi:hypothetical protein
MWSRQCCHCVHAGHMDVIARHLGPFISVNLVAITHQLPCGSDGTEAHWVDVPLAAFLAHRRCFRPPPPPSVALSGCRRVYVDIFFQQL